MAAIPPSLLQMFGPIESLLSDPTVRRVLVDAADAILVERHGRVERTPLGYPPGALEESLDALARRAGKPFDSQHPSLEAQLKDGTRFLALRSPAVERGPMLVVVRPGGRLTDLAGLVRQDALSEEAAAALTAAMRAGLNIAVVGPADSGRTTFLEALTAGLAPGVRIVVLEEHAELRLPERDPTRMQTRKADKDGNGAVTMADLLYFAGRMAVDRVVIGDLRWQDASETVNLLSSRLSPVVMALSGLNAEDALARLEALARASATGGRDRAAGGLVSTALDLVVTLGRHEGQRAVVSIDRVRAGGERARLETLFARSSATGWTLAATPEAAALVEAWQQAAAPAPVSDDDGTRETLGYLPAIPLMTDSHRLPEAAAVQRAAPPTPAPPAAAPVAVSPAEAPRLSLSPQATPARAPMPVPRGATLDATPPPEPVAPAPASGGDPLATDNMFATLRPGFPGEGADPLRRLLQGLRSDAPGESEPTPAVTGRDTGDAPMAGAPATVEAPVPALPPDVEMPEAAAAAPTRSEDPDESADDEEHTVVNDPIPTSTARDDGEGRPGKTFSQVLRNLGVGPGESQEISGAWTGVNIVTGRPTLPAAEGEDAMERTRETSSPVAGRTTRVHATDD